jgi:peptidoglycan/LPS O-acetylase OafA/YrhL
MSTDQAVAAPVPRRLTSLDGLRGLAAFVVVLHHLALTVPALATSVRDGAAGGSAFWADLVTFSPVHLLWQGTTAVTVFFVLSGFVLALPWVGPQRRSGWLRYYVGRLPRLYLPVWVALGLSVLAVVTVYPGSPPTATWWLDQHTGIAPVVALRDAVLVTGTSDIDSPLWSLQWEVIFSLLLPLYVLAARRLSARLALLAGVLLLAVVAIGKLTDVLALQYLPIFGLGVLVARHLDVLSTMAQRWTRRGRWTALGVVTLLLLNAEWLLGAVPSVPRLAAEAGVGAALVGSVLAVLIALFAPRVRSFLQTPVLQWLGSRSFSLYLVHEPIVVACAFTVGRSAPWITAAVAVPSALVIAELFFRFVERPSHRLARSLAKRVPVSRGGHRAGVGAAAG